MKFVSVIILAALLCVVAVSTAPSTPSEMSELFANGPFNTLDRVNKYYKQMRCTFDVAGNVVAEDKSIEKDVREIKALVDDLFNEEWVECDGSGNDFDVLTCKSEVIVNLYDAFTAYTQIVDNINKELAEKIRQQTETQCKNKSNLFELDEEVFVSAGVEEFAFNPLYSISDRLQKYLDRFRCALEVIAKEVRYDENLEKEFDEIKSAFEKLINENWKKCNSAGNPIGAAKCKIGVLGKLGTAFTKFIQKVTVANVELAGKIRVELKKCRKG